MTFMPVAPNNASRFARNTAHIQYLDLGLVFAQEICSFEAELCVALEFTSELTHLSPLLSHNNSYWMSVDFAALVALLVSSGRQASY